MSTTTIRVPFDRLDDRMGIYFDEAGTVEVSVEDGEFRCVEAIMERARQALSRVRLEGYTDTLTLDEPKAFEAWLWEQRPLRLALQEDPEVQAPSDAAFGASQHGVSRGDEGGVRAGARSACAAEAAGKPESAE